MADANDKLPLVRYTFFDRGGEWCKYADAQAALSSQAATIAQLQRDLDEARGALLEISQRSCGCEPDTTWVCDACIARAALAGAKGESERG